MANFINNDKEIILKSLGHLYVICKLNENFNTYDEFLTDKIKLDSSIFHLTQVGELCTKYTNEFRNSNFNINFRDIIGLRNIMVHGYGTLHYDEIFDIIKEDVPKLMICYRDILSKNYNFKDEDIDTFINNYYNTRKFQFSGENK